MISLVSHLGSQAFLPYQCEAALVPIFCFGNGAIGAFYKSNWKKAFFFVLFMTALTLLAVSAQEDPRLRLVSLSVRALLSCFLGYAAIFKSRKSRAETAFVWIITDPLGWVVEIAFLLRSNDPIFQVSINMLANFFLITLSFLFLNSLFFRSSGRCDVRPLLDASLLVCQTQIQGAC